MKACLLFFLWFDPYFHQHHCSGTNWTLCPFICACRIALTHCAPSHSLWLFRHSDTWVGFCVRWWQFGLCDWSVCAGLTSAAADEGRAHRQFESGRSGQVCSTNPEPLAWWDAAAAAEAGSRHQKRDDVWNTTGGRSWFTQGPIS